LLLNATDGLTETDASTRIADPTNSVGFLVAHLINTRYRLAAMIGAPGDDPVARHLEGARSIDQVASLPMLEAMRTMWSDAGTHLTAALGSATAEQLSQPIPRALPNGDPTMLGAIAFFVQHESYHLGQIAMLRKALGQPAMTYKRRA
jgi:uncharacterized damage-inducible protein DinB